MLHNPLHFLSLELQLRTNGQQESSHLYLCLLKFVGKIHFLELLLHFLMLQLLNSSHNLPHHLMYALLIVEFHHLLCQPPHYTPILLAIPSHHKPHRLHTCQPYPHILEHHQAMLGCEGSLMMWVGILQLDQAMQVCCEVVHGGLGSIVIV